jgi:uncharacterized membrane protein YeiH
VFRRGLYVIPALLGARITVAAIRAGAYGPPAALAAVFTCFAVRMLGVRYGLNAPMPPGTARGAPPGRGGATGPDRGGR